MKSFLITVSIVFLSLIGNAQYYSWGNDPGSIHWKQIQTDRFQVIFPEGSDSVAQRFTNLLEYVYVAVGTTLNHEPAKISVILHTQSGIANGSVAWAPKRMDIFDVVPQEQIAMEWLEQLAIHEFRHVVQMDKLNEGLTKIFYFLLGQQAVGLVSGLYLPSWYMEGDAVTTETALSNSGRGRQPDFTMALRAQLLQKKQYSYLKAYFGSYRNYVPNHYHMGYIVVANARDIYGPQLWENVEDRVARRPLSFHPFSKSIQIQTKLNKRELYRDMFKKQAIDWKLDYDREMHKSFDTLTKPNPKEFTCYIHPQRISDSYVIAEKYGLGNASQIVKISKEGIETTLAYTSFKQQNERIQTNGEYIVWSENNPHIRWELKGTSDIYMYSISTNKSTKIKTKSRVFSPCISKAGDKIIASEIDEKSLYWLVVYNTTTKKEIQKIKLPNQEYALTPTWNFDATKCVYVGVSTKGKRLVEIDLRTNEENVIIPYTYDDIMNPVYWNDFIIYSSSYSGVDNLYAIHTQTKEILRVTVSSFGAKYPSVYHQVLLFSDYSADGYLIGQAPLDLRSWHSIDVVRKAQYPLADNMSRQETKKIDFSQMKDSTYAVKNYSKVLHAINIHSWMPFYLEYNGGSVSDKGLGFQFNSQDNLGTTVTSVGFKQNLSDGRQAGFVKVKYTGSFPVFEIEYQNGHQIFQDSIGNDLAKAMYHVSEISGNMSLPLDFSSRSWYRYLTFAGQISYAKYEKLKVDPNSYDSFYEDFMDIGIMAYTASFMNVRQPSQRDIAPRLGQIFVGGFGHSPLQAEKVFHEYIFGAGQLYLPGFAKHHSIEIYGGYEWNADTVSQNFQSQISVPRGYIDEVFLRQQMISGHINYTFPVLYPDVAWRSILYVKRIRANAFFDYAQMQIASPAPESLMSYGAEVVMDFHLAHLQVPLTYGMRFSYRPDKGLWTVQPVFTANFGAL